MKETKKSSLNIKSHKQTNTKLQRKKTNTQTRTHRHMDTPQDIWQCQYVPPWWPCKQCWSSCPWSKCPIPACMWHLQAYHCACDIFKLHPFLHPSFLPILFPFFSHLSSTFLLFFHLASLHLDFIYFQIPSSFSNFFSILLFPSFILLSILILLSTAPFSPTSFFPSPPLFFLSHLNGEVCGSTDESVAFQVQATYLAWVAQQSLHRPQTVGSNVPHLWRWLWWWY